jgi:hypothetical protein
MEKKNAKLKNTFTNLISHISKMYKEVSNVNNDAYLIGRKEAFEEMLNWYVTTHNGELKYISATSFFNMMQEKLAKTKAAIATKLSPDEEEEIKPTMNFSEIKISDNKKRVNRYAAMEVTQNVPIEEEENSIGMSNVGNNSNNSNNAINSINSINSSNPPVQPSANLNSAINFPFSVNSLIHSNNFLLNQGNLASGSHLMNNINTNNSGLFANTINPVSNPSFANPFQPFGLNQQTQAQIQPSLFSLPPGTNQQTNTMTSTTKKKKK